MQGFEKVSPGIPADCFMCFESRDQHILAMWWRAFQQLTQEPEGPVGGQQQCARCSGVRQQVGGVQQVDQRQGAAPVGVVSDGRHDVGPGAVARLRAAYG